MVTGIVLRLEGSACVVHADGREWSCDLRGTLRDALRRQKQPVVVGDRVRLVSGAGERGVIEEVQPRRSKFARRAVHGTREQVVVANADRLLVVASAGAGEFQPRLIDRFLVAAAQGSLEGVVVFNKLDLVADDGALEQWSAIYRAIGYRVLGTSALDGRGLEELSGLLADGVAILAGASGVGKTTLINRLIPGCELSTADVDLRTGQGRHTTSQARLLPLPRGGYVVDTAGVRQLGLFDLSPAILAAGFPDLSAFVGDCRFPDCRHRQEPGCAVRDASSRGLLHPLRYESYRAILESLEGNTEGRTWKGPGASGARFKHGYLRGGSADAGREEVDDFQGPGPNNPN